MDPISGIPFIDWFFQVLDTLGYLIVFVATIFENLFVVGSLTPGETVVIAAAFVSAIGRLQLAGVWIASVLGTVLGSNVSYWLGRRLGHNALLTVTGRIEASRLGKIVRISTESVRDSEAYFERHGAHTVLLSRFAIGAKNFVPVIAGASRMSVFWFQFYTLVGAVVYTSLMCAIGWFVGRLAGSAEENLQLALNIAGGIGWVGLAVVIVVVGFAIYGGRRAARRIRARRASSDEDEGAEGESGSGSGSGGSPPRGWSAFA